MNSTSIGVSRLHTTYSYEHQLIPRRTTEWTTDLENSQEMIQLAPLTTAIKAHTTTIKQCANETDAEEVVHRVNRAIATRYRKPLTCCVSCRCSRYARSCRGDVPCPNEMSDQRVSKMTLALTTRYMYSSPRYRTAEMRL